jgi:triosephosphate isomerase
MGGGNRTPLVVGNWKMNLTEVWAAKLLDALLPALAGRDATEVGLAPAFPVLPTVRARIAGTPLRLAAQNMHWEDDGAFTGEVSPRMLVDGGVDMVILGHSERRTLFEETDERVGLKVAAARRHELVPILCVGEREDERDSGQTLAVVERQLRLGLAEARADDCPRLVLAYEPVWAIGTGRSATAAQVDEVHRMIREQLGSLYGAAAAATVRILYGGSVNPDNAPELMGLDEVDGALVGGASLDADKFTAIVAATA